MLAALLRAGADADKARVDGDIALMLAVYDGRDCWQS